jgi:transposase
VLKIQITKDEEVLLRAHIKATPVALIRFKSQAVMLASEGVSPDVVCLAVDRKSRTVVSWLKDWSDRRMASIFSGHQDNTNAAKLTKAQLEQIREALASPPSELGIPKEMWDVPTLKEYVSATFGIVYESPESYYFILRFSGLSFKYPDVFDLRRNEDLILERMQSIRAEIKPLKHRADWEIFAVDEVKMQQEAVIRRCWLKKGERTVIKVDRKQQNQSYIGFLNQKDYQCHLYEMADKQNSKTVLIAMKQFLREYPDKRIAIIWDNASFHKSKEIREQLKRGGIMERVHLIPMPPYAPDENPIEHVWNTAKQKVANLQRETFEDTKKAFYDFVTERSFRYSF